MIHIVLLLNMSHHVEISTNCCKDFLCSGFVVFVALK